MVVLPLVEIGLTAAIGEVAATGAIAGISGLTVSSIATSALFIGGAIGAEMLLKQNKPASYSPWQPQLPVATNVSAQSIGPRYHANGRLRVGGVYHFRESTGAAILGYGIVLNCGPIDGIEKFYIDDEAPTMSGGPVTYYPVSGMKYAATFTKVWSYGQWVPVPTGNNPAGTLEFRNASNSGAVSSLLSANFPSIWTSDRYCKGLACLYAAWNSQSISNLLSVYPNRFPQHSQVIRGEPVYDPRDATQNFADPTTWKYTRAGVPDPGRNPALIWAHYWTNPDGGRLGYIDIDWTAVAQAANDCDRTVTGYGEAEEPFAQCDIQWHAGETPSEVENRILATCDGIPYESGGKQAIWIAQAVTPTITLTDADISSVSWDESAGALAETNYVQASYSEPRLNYSFLATAPDTDDASIAAVGERAQTVELRCVTNHSQAYRIAHRVLRRQNPPLRVTITVGPRGIRAMGEFMIRIDAPAYGLSGVFRPIDLFQIEPDFSRATAQFAQVADDAFDDVVAPSDPVSPDLGGVGTVTGAYGTLVPQGIPTSVASGHITANAWTYQVTAGVTPNPGFTPIGTPVDTTLVFYVRSREVDHDTHAPLGGGDWLIWPPNYIDEWTFEGPVMTTGTYELQAWFVSSITGLPGDFSASVFVDVA